MKVKLGEYIQEYSVRNKANEDIPVYSVTNTQGFCQDYFGKEVASKDKSTYKIVPKGYFAYNPSRINVGSVDWQRDEDQVIVSPLYNVFSVSPELNQQYLYYYLKSDFALHRIKAVATGSVRDNLKLEMLKNFPIRIPSVEEQEYIVQALDKAKNIIDLRRSVLQKLDDLIKARFAELFGDTFSNPKRWPTKTFREASLRLSDGPFGSNLKSEHYSENGVRVIRLGNIGVGKFIDKDQSYVSLDHYSRLKKYTCKPGEIVIGTLGEPNLRACIIPDYVKLAVNKADCVHYVPDSKILENTFVCQYINCPTTLLLASNMVHGQTRARVSSGQIAKMPIFIPPLSLQQQFADFVAQIDKSKSHDPHLPIPPLKWYPLPKNEVPIMEEKIIAITNEMAEILNIAQLKKLQEVLVKVFSAEEPERKPTNQEYLRLFLEAKSIEGCSPRTLQYYEVTVQHLFAAVNLPVRKMTTERMREYLSDYQQRRNCSKATIDNIRRNISSFFS